MNEEELNFKAADGMYGGIEFVLTYMKERVEPSLSMLIGKRTAREEYLLGYYYLVRGWLQTLKKLNEDKDLQAIMTCTRALVELTVDTIQLYKDSSRKTIRLMLHFDRYQKLKMARALVEYFDNQGKTIPNQYEELEQYYRKRKYRVEKKKKELWPNKKQLQRWSGNNLITDIREADKLLRYAIEEELGMSLEDFHETEYRRLHWYVHGSGLSGYWNMPAKAFSLVCALGFYWSCNLAMLCVKVTLATFHITAVADMDAEWQRVKLARNTVFLELNPHLISEEAKGAVKEAKKILGFESNNSVPR